MLSPEAPYPLRGGGAYRTASLLHYFARRAAVDFIFISDTGKPALLPEGLVRSQTVIPLAPHRRDPLARYARNALRAVRGVPPLMDRLSGLGSAIERVIAGRRYDVAVIEHFWCAPYAGEMFRVCNRTILNLHNVESVLHERCAATGGPLTRLGHARFARAARDFEAKLLPGFSAVLTPSEQDAARVRAVAPSVPVITFPNSIPMCGVPPVGSRNSIAFSGNFEYHPNIDAVRFLVRDIWPIIRRAKEDVRLRLIGRGDRHIRRLIRHDERIEATGEVEDAMAEIASALVVLAPLRAGSGTRIKILEAWAAARPVVATTVAAEGLEARQNDNCVLADNPAEFAAAVLKLLESDAVRRRLGARARGTFEHLYTWECVWKNLDISLQVL